LSGSWILLLVGAGVLAGLLAAVGGLASLVSYPALLLAGLPPAAANVTNTVALVSTMAGGAAGSRPELAGHGRRVAQLSAVSALGGAAGAALLLTTPESLFEAVVPWLIGGASVVLLAGPWLRRAASGMHHGVRAGVFLVAIYAGYFGAAAGVIMLALLTITTDESLARATAAKTIITGAANAVAAVVFALIGPVHWPAAIAMGTGALIGSRLGPWAVRRLPATPLRMAIALAGMGLALKLGLG
jgi:uncharacterized protein